MSAEQPGWYADPSGSRGTFRWWDGRAWTRWLSADAEAAPPSEAPEAAPVPAAAPAGAADTTVPAGPAPAPAPAAATPEPVAAEPRVGLPLAVAVVTGALLAGVLAVAAVVSASAERLPSGPAVPPPTPSAVVPVVSYDVAARTASVAELRLVLPGAPYTCGTAGQPQQPTFSSVLLCAAPVHENYRGSADWTATTGIGVVPEALTVPDDPKATADRVFGSLRGQFFAGQRTEVHKLVAERFAAAPEGAGIAVSGEVHYTVAGVPSRYDRVVVLVVELADGGYGVWFSSRPEDTPEATLAVLDTSIGTLTAR